MKYVRMLCVVLCLAGVGILLLAADADNVFTLTSPAFKKGAPISDKYSQKGGNVSPPLVWHNAPKSTKSFALLVEDPDAPHGTSVHWVMFNIPGKVDALPEGIPAKIPADTIAYGALQ